jgi:formyltetrahydrofolate hydrolase
MVAATSTTVPAEFQGRALYHQAHERGVKLTAPRGPLRRLI